MANICSDASITNESSNVNTVFKYLFEYTKITGCIYCNYSLRSGAWDMAK